MKKNNAKRTVVVIALIALMAIPSMFAYFTDKTDTEKSTFTTGDIEITLENGVTGEDVVPNEPLTGSVAVKNVGKNPAYVFVEVDAENVSFDTEAGWVKYADNVYAYGEKNGDVVTLKEFPVADTAVTVIDGTKVVVDPELVSETHEKETYKFDVTAYAVQSEFVSGMTNDALWTLAQSPVAEK